MNNKKLNELKIKNNELKEKIKILEENKKMFEDKEELTRSRIVKSIIVGGIGYILGIFINPIITLASTLFICLNVIPGGIITLYYQSKENKYKNEIIIHQKEIEKNEKYIVSFYDKAYTEKSSIKNKPKIKKSSFDKINTQKR